jgi:hypothetical protein
MPGALYRTHFKVEPLSCLHETQANWCCCCCCPVPNPLPPFLVYTRVPTGMWCRADVLLMHVC